ncbi:hypothetical protein WSM22_04250 [Cytophagales bacterium WSM2-2]|nr:hypothetical protein WSM22_04250 [Cytophagales bacterium WSM2-2]
MSIPKASKSPKDSTFDIYNISIDAFWFNGDSFKVAFGSFEVSVDSESIKVEPERFDFDIHNIFIGAFWFTGDSFKLVLDSPGVSVDF